MVCVNETHLDELILDTEIQMSGFKLYRSDRDFNIESCTNEVTRHSYVNGTLQESTLDQILSTNDAIVSDFTVVSAVGKSDHMSIVTDFNLYDEKEAFPEKLQKTNCKTVEQSHSPSAS